MRISCIMQGFSNWRLHRQFYQFIMMTLKSPHHEAFVYKLWLKNHNMNRIMCCRIFFIFFHYSLGLPLPILSVSADSAFSRMLFVDYRHMSSEETLHCQGQTQCKIHLLVTCKSGACHILTTWSGTESHASQLTERFKQLMGYYGLKMDWFRNEFEFRVNPVCFSND